MEAVLRNVSGAAELLAAAAHSDAVKRWDEQTLSRAFDWARYCEHVFNRFHHNRATSRVVEEQLQITNRSLQVVFPAHTAVSFPDLSRCQHLLLVGLLNNPELPSSIVKILFDVNGEQSEHRDVAGLCSRIIRCKSACDALRPLTGPSAVGADAEVQGAMLTERLGALLSRGGGARRAEQFLDSVLRGCEGAAAEHFCPVIAAALLTTENSQSAAQDFLLDRLQKKPDELRHMCSALPDAVVTALAKEHLKFRDAYLGALKKLASDMEYSLDEGEWVQPGANQTASFQRLAERFLVLFRACPSLRQDVEKDLNALKISDGDFDVRGLSVWGDLLSALNK